jgi:hypothetical protein
MSRDQWWIYLSMLIVRIKLAYSSLVGLKTLLRGNEFFQGIILLCWFRLALN